MTGAYWEDEEWEEAPEESDEPTPPAIVAPGLQRSLALGLLAMAPLLLVYEMALTAGGGRNTSELLLFRLFAVMGDHGGLARRWTLGLLTLAAFVHCFKRERGLGPRLGRVILEGAIASILIGPLLIGMIHLMGDALPPLELNAGAATSPPALERAARVLGAGAYEELVFRVGVYSALFVLISQISGFAGAGRKLRRGLGDAVGLLGSAALFSAFHLESFVSWLGTGGEPFEPAMFTYRMFAGILLGVLFRLRGPGVAAWTHGLFNLALLLGAGPEVFL